MFRVITALLMCMLLGSCSGESESSEHSESGQKYFEACYAFSLQMLGHFSSDLPSSASKELLDVMEGNCSCEAKKYPEILTYAELDDLIAMMKRDTRDKEMASMAKIELYKKLSASNADKYFAAMESCN